MGSCKDDEEINPIPYYKCRKRCKTGQMRHPITNRCRKIKGPKVIDEIKYVFPDEDGDEDQGIKYVFPNEDEDEKKKKKKKVCKLPAVYDPNKKKCMRCKNKGAKYNVEKGKCIVKRKKVRDNLKYVFPDDDGDDNKLSEEDRADLIDYVLKSEEIPLSQPKTVRRETSKGVQFPKKQILRYMVMLNDALADLDLQDGDLKSEKVVFDAFKEREQKVDNREEFAKLKQNTNLLLGYVPSNVQKRIGQLDQMSVAKLDKLLKKYRYPLGPNVEKILKRTVILQIERGLGKLYQLSKGKE